MYLHELGEEAASFTKDEMQAGYVLLNGFIFLLFILHAVVSAVAFLCYFCT